MDNRSFVTRTLVLGFVIGMLILSTICCVGTFMFFNRPDNTAVEPAPATTPVAQVPTPVVAEGSRICRYAEGTTAEGIVVAQGTVVRGPAFVKPDRNRDHVLLILDGASYTTKATDEVVWILVGDNACVRSQEQFFGSSEEITR